MHDNTGRLYMHVYIHIINQETAKERDRQTDRHTGRQAGRPTEVLITTVSMCTDRTRGSSSAWSVSTRQTEKQRECVCVCE